MALDPIDTKTLMLKDGSLQKLRALFDELKGEIDTQAQNFKAYNCDLGMQECVEGRSWDEKVNEAYNKVFDSLTKFTDNATEFQGRLVDVENAYDENEQRSAENFKKLAKDTGLPAPGQK